MENDVLKNKIAPWQEKGRWYHGLWNLATNAFESVETDAELLSSDYEIQVSAYTAYLNPKIDIKKAIIKAVLKQRSAVTMPAAHTANIGNHRFYANGTVGMAFAPSSASSSGLFDVWLFIVKE